MSSIVYRSCEVILKEEKKHLSHEVVCFHMLDFETSILILRFRKQITIRVHCLHTNIICSFQKSISYTLLSSVGSNKIHCINFYTPVFALYLSHAYHMVARKRCTCLNPPCPHCITIKIHY